jgi:NAD(P)-dependent dehydrogenase (short-subunit alcohol dehydrogenase family)
MALARYDSAVLATLSGVLDRLRPAPVIGALGSEDRLEGRSCLVTGANVGLGRAVAIRLARLGARLILAGRTPAVDTRAAASAEGAGEVRLEELDLAQLRSVLAFCDRLQGERLDVSVLNAGVVARESRRTPDGLDEMFQVNYLANAALLRRLLADGTIPNRSFAAGASDPTPGPVPRIILVSSEAHRSSRLDPERLEPARYGIRGAVAEYGRGKLLLTAYGTELARRLGREVAVHALCPGAVNTRIAREAPAWSQPLLALVFRLLFRSPETAALPVVYLAAARAIEGRTALYLHTMVEKPVSPAASDPVAGRRLWEASDRLLARVLGSGWLSSAS